MKIELLLRWLMTIVLTSSSIAANAQCVSINCPANVTVSNTPGQCGAVVNYVTPVGTTSCSNTVTFNYTGSIVNWTVPAGITSITIQANGAQGSQSTSSTTTSGLGASMTGTFTVTPGQVLKILVGQQFSATGGNGGGGGTFVTDISNNPLIVAGGGGGSSQGADSPDKHGKITTTGGTGAGGGGVGGSGGNGGSIGSSGFQSGAGGGLLTNGTNGWAAGTGGTAFVNGGNGGGSNANANGGFGGGGTGSSYVVGGGGGGYSGGGSGGNSVAGVGGGGGSFNAGTNQNNVAGTNTGHGSVIITIPTTVTTTQTAGLASGATFPIGTTTNTYSVTDGTNTTTCSFTVTVTDNEDPVLTCPANMAVNNDAGVCGAAVTYVTPVGTDNCSGVNTTQTAGFGSGAVYPIGTTTNTFVSADAAGNPATCSFTVTVVDNELPTITCPANITASADPGLCGAVVTYLPPLGTDNCTGSNTMHISGGQSGDTYPIGVSTISYGVVDAANNTAQCSFTISVTDDEDPTITCPGNVNVCDPVVTAIGPGNSADNCTVSGITYSTTGATNLSGNNDISGSTFNIGLTTVTYTATDANGNTGTCSFDVDIMAPTNQLATTTSSNTENITGNISVVNNDCDLIATIIPSGGDPISGSTNVGVTIDPVVNNYGGQLYLQRHYDIEPATNAANATATVTLYALQSEFDAFNVAAAGTGDLPMPTGGVDNGYIRITQYHGTGTAPGNYTGATEVSTPAVAWNATDNRWELTFPVTGFSGFYIHTALGNFPLSITLTDIKVNNVGNRNQLMWATASEEKSDRFGLEHSTDGVSFKEIYNTAAKGQASQYTYWHQTPAIGKNFYRLKLYNNGSDAKFSNVVTAVVRSKDNFSIEAYPNPVKNILSVEVSGQVDGVGQLSLTDISGKVIATRTISGNTTTFDMSGQASGIYFIKYSDVSRNEVIKVNKQ